MTACAYAYSFIAITYVGTMLLIASSLVAGF